MNTYKATLCTAMAKMSNGFTFQALCDTAFLTHSPFKIIGTIKIAVAGQLHVRVDLEDILNRFVKKHEPIQSSFFSSNTISVMKIDAEIAEYIINHFTDQGTPVLAIHDSFLINRIYEDDLKTVMQTACRKIPLRLFNQNVTKTKVGYEGIDLTGFTDLISRDRNFMIDTFFKDKYSDREVQRRKEVESYKELVGKEDYYYSAKS